MPYIFVPDGGPEADEYDSNYVWYSASDEESYARALAEAEALLASRTGVRDLVDLRSMEPPMTAPDA